MKKKSYDKETQLNLNLIVALNRSLSNLRKRELPVIRDAGLTLPQFGVLEVLYHKGDMRICAIIEKTLSTGGNMTVVINNLIKDKLISRYKDPEDQRAYIVKLTDKGHTLMEELFPKHIVTINQEFEHMTKEERSQLLHLLKKYNKRLP